MKRILPFLLAIPFAAYAFACSSDSDDNNNNNGGGNADGGDNNNGGGDTDGGGNNNPGDPNVNPTTGITVAQFANPSAATHGLAWVPAEKAFYATLPGSTFPFDSAPGVTTVGKLVRINADGVTSFEIFGGTAATGAMFSTAFNAKANKVVVLGTNQLLSLTPNVTTYQATLPVTTSEYSGLESDDAGTAVTPLRGLNDVVFKKDGSGYATEPYYSPTAPQAALNRVYLIRADNTAASVAHYENNERPNGVALSPDEKTLYVALTSPNVPDPGRNLVVYGEFPAIWKYTVNADGSLSAGAKFVQVGTTKSVEEKTKPDGLAVDTAGNVYVATVDGVAVFKPSGEPWGVIPTPEQAASLSFGGDDLKTLYIGASNDPCDTAVTPGCNPVNKGLIYKAAMPIAGISR